MPHHGSIFDSPAPCIRYFITKPSQISYPHLTTQVELFRGQPQQCSPQSHHHHWHCRPLQNRLPHPLDLHLPFTTLLPTSAPFLETGGKWGGWRPRRPSSAVGESAGKSCPFVMTFHSSTVWCIRARPNVSHDNWHMVCVHVPASYSGGNMCSTCGNDFICYTRLT